MDLTRVDRVRPLAICRNGPASLAIVTSIMPESTPRRVAVIGASSNRKKFGNRALRAFLRQGYDVVAINPNESVVEGLRTYATVLDVPGAIDMATFYVPPHVGLVVIDQVADKGISEVWLNPGSESQALVERARQRGIEPIEACSVMAIGEVPN